MYKRLKIIVPAAQLLGIVRYANGLLSQRLAQI